MNRIRFFGIILLAGIGGTLRAQPTVPVLHDGEQIALTVSYRAKLVPNTEVARVVLETERDTLDGRLLYRVTGNGRVLPSFRWFYNLNDTYYTWLDPTSGRPRLFQSELREGGYHAASEFRYDWPGQRVVTHKQRRDNPPVVRTLALSEGSYDGLALFYNLRGSDFSALRPGDTHMLDLLLDDTVRQIRYRFIGREEKRIRGVGTFRTLRFTCQMATSEGKSFDDGAQFTLWVTDDRNRIPVLFESPIKVGSIRAYLASYKGLPYPLESKID